MDSTDVSCKYCQETQPLQERDAHQAACGAAIVACPYKGCSFESARSVLDVHVVTCSYSQLYSAVRITLARPATFQTPHLCSPLQAAVLDLICQRCAQQRVPSLDPRLFEGLSQPEDVIENDRIVHHVQSTDTLAGLAVRYMCHQADIKRMNRLMSDVALFGRKTVLIPRSGELP
jgi:hypothetical protein